MAAAAEVQRLGASGSNQLRQGRDLSFCSAKLRGLNEMKKLMQLKELYGWDDDDPRFLKEKDESIRTTRRWQAR